MPAQIQIVTEVAAVAILSLSSSACLSWAVLRLAFGTGGERRA